MTDKPKGKPKNDDKPKNTLITGNGGRWLLFNMLLAVAILWILQWVAYLTKPNIFDLSLQVFIGIVTLNLLQSLDLPLPLRHRRSEWVFSVMMAVLFTVIIIGIMFALITEGVLYFVGTIYGLAVGWQLGQRFHVNSIHIERGHIMSGQILAFTMIFGIFFISQYAIGIMAKDALPNGTPYLLMAIFTAILFALLQYGTFSHYLD